MKKKLLIITIIATFLMTMMSSCELLNDPDFHEGFRQGWNSSAPPKYRY